MKVDVAVIVIVGHGRAEVVARAGQSQSLGHVLEFPAAEVAIEAVPEPRLTFVRRPGRRGIDADGRAVGEEQIEPPIAVGIENRHAPAHRFRQELHARLRGDVAEGDAGRGGRVGERHPACRRQNAKVPVQNDRTPKVLAASVAR